MPGHGPAGYRKAVDRERPSILTRAGQGEARSPGQEYELEGAVCNKTSVVPSSLLHIPSERALTRPLFLIIPMTGKCEIADEHHHVEDSVRTKGMGFNRRAGGQWQGMGTDAHCPGMGTDAHCPGREASCGETSVFRIT